MTTRPRVAILFGGRSAEHEISLLSARNVARAIDPDRYDLVPIAVTRDGRWLLIDLDNGVWPDAVPGEGTEVCLVPGGKGRLLACPAQDLPPIDVLFPVLHGLFGEDGSVQGYAEVAGIAFVGCGILASAAALDKDIAKRLLNQAGLSVARGLTLRPDDPVAFDDVVNRLGSPVFVKPVRQGSSVGVARVATAEAFSRALRDAFTHDGKVLVEEFVRGREIECGILEDADGALTVSLPGEIVPAAAHGFYSYEAKYIDPDGAAIRIPADLPAAVTLALQETARRAFRALDCEGMARVDFFVKPDMSPVINELNTIPGFTDISMYPKAFAAGGIPGRALVGRLIQHALSRAAAGR